MKNQKMIGIIIAAIGVILLIFNPTIPARTTQPAEIVAPENYVQIFPIVGDYQVRTWYGNYNTPNQYNMTANCTTQGTQQWWLEQPPMDVAGYNHIIITLAGTPGTSIDVSINALNSDGIQVNYNLFIPEITSSFQTYEIHNINAASAWISFAQSYPVGVQAWFYVSKIEAGNFSPTPSPTATPSPTPTPIQGSGGSNYFTTPTPTPIESPTESPTEPYPSISPTPEPTTEPEQNPSGSGLQILGLPMILMGVILVIDDKRKRKS